MPIVKDLMIPMEFSYFCDTQHCEMVTGIMMIALAQDILDFSNFILFWKHLEHVPIQIQHRESLLFSCLTMLPMLFSI